MRIGFGSECWCVHAQMPVYTSGSPIPPRTNGLIQTPISQLASAYLPFGSKLPPFTASVRCKDYILQYLSESGPPSTGGPLLIDKKPFPDEQTRDLIGFANGLRARGFSVSRDFESGPDPNYSHRKSPQFL
jgi:hypothetical protein